MGAVYIERMNHGASIGPGLGSTADLWQPNQQLQGNNIGWIYKGSNGIAEDGMGREWCLRGLLVGDVPGYVNSEPSLLFLPKGPNRCFQELYCHVYQRVFSALFTCSFFCDKTMQVRGSN